MYAIAEDHVDPNLLFAGTEFAAYFSKDGGAKWMKIAGLPNGDYALAVYRTGYMQNDAYTSYLHMGSPSQLTRAQVAALQQSASGAPSETRTVTIRNHVFEQHFEMHQNDAVLVTLKPL